MYLSALRTLRMPNFSDSSYMLVLLRIPGLNIVSSSTIRPASCRVRQRAWRCSSADYTSTTPVPGPSVSQAIPCCTASICTATLVAQAAQAGKLLRIAARIEPSPSTRFRAQSLRADCREPATEKNLSGIIRFDGRPYSLTRRLHRDTIGLPPKPQLSRRT